jgi:uncharacterized protein YueI
MFGQPQDGEYIEVIPAYGRDYKNKKEIEADLLTDRDFQLSTTRQYINLAQMVEHQFRVIVRYGNQMKVADMTPVVTKAIKNSKASK